MAALLKSLTGIYPTSEGMTGDLKTVLIFSATGLLVSILALTYGLDLSPGFF